MKRAKVETASALLPHFSASQNALSKYIKSISMMNVASAREYSFRLQGFGSFIYNEYGIDLDNLIKKLNKGLLNPYDVLSNYIVHLKANDSISTLTLKQRVTTAKNFLEYFDVDISPRKFKLKVKLPKVVRKDIQPITKQIITNILNSCSDLRLKTYVMLLAATGMRASEALSIRLVDCNLDANPPRLQIRGEYTKTKVSRFVFLTQELVQPSQI
jgi:integrase